MLLWNLHYNYQYGYRIIGSGASNDRLMGQNPTFFNNRFCSEAGIQPTTAIPDGYRPPYTAHLPMKDGGLGAHTGLDGGGSLAASVVGGINAAASLLGDGSLTSLISAIGKISTTLSGLGSVLANAVNGIAANATLSGLGSVTAGATPAMAASADIDGYSSIQAQLVFAQVYVDILNLISEISMELNSISEISTILSVDSPLHKV